DPPRSWSSVFPCTGDPLYLTSFPTRRSSDLMNVNWRYVWPRDAAFVAVAFAAAGHLDDAVGVLEYLQRVQGTDGRFEARYVPDGDRKSTRLNSSHVKISYAVFCLKKKNNSAP